MKWSYDDCGSPCGTASYGEVEDYTVVIESADKWLTIAPSSGSVTQGASQDLTVTFDATGLAEGTYTGHITVNSNDPGQPQVVVPCTMHVALGYMVSGTVTYDNGASTPIETLTSVSLSPFGSCPTTTGGYYEFLTVPNGSYMMTASCTKPWGGVTTIDGTLATRFALGLTTLAPLRQKAADVNKSNDVTSIDGILIKRRALGNISSWPAPNWIFDDGSFASPGVPVNVSGGNVIHHLKALCSGDVNGSYTPPPAP
jgi:hypothetical protein